MLHPPPTCVAASLPALVTSRWHCSQVVTLCSHQLHLPAPAAKGKSANVFVSSWLWGLFFQRLCSGARCRACDTQRISITDKLTGQRATIPTSVRGDSHFKSLPYSNYTLIALKAQVITALVISNQKLSIFVASPSLCWGCSGYGPSKRQHIRFTITSALLWLSKRRIASISLWRIECICIVESLVSSSEQIYCPSLSLSPLDCISVYWAPEQRGRYFWLFCCRVCIVSLFLHDHTPGTSS